MVLIGVMVVVIVMSYLHIAVNHSQKLNSQSFSFSNADIQ